MEIIAFQIIQLLILSKETKHVKQIVWYEQNRLENRRIQKYNWRLEKVFPELWRGKKIY
jgi:hypothetical protein